MGTLSKNYLKGAVGPIIFYNYHGRTAIKSKPLKVRQTKATKESAKLFGKASNLSARLRAGLEDILANPREREIRYELNTALQEWLRTLPSAGTGELLMDIPILHEHEFNKDSKLSTRIRVPLAVDWTNAGKAILKIPSLVPVKDIRAKAYTEIIEMIITIARAEVFTKYITDPVGDYYSTRLNIPYNEEMLPAQQIELPFTLTPGYLYIVAAALKYKAPGKRGLMEVEEKRWLPAGIISSCCSF